MNKKKYDLITILGPTASGKTALAVALAAKVKGEILSADSRQVYKGMDIGTGKDLSEYCVNGVNIPFHLIDIVDAGTHYNVFEYQKAFLNSYYKIKENNHQAIICGGSGMYIEAVVNGYDLKPVPPNEELRNELEQHSLTELTDILKRIKTLHNRTDVDTKKRAIRAIEIETYYLEHPEEMFSYPPLTNIYFGIDIDRELRRERISKRLRARLDEGMVDEVEGLLKKGVTAEDLAYYGLEYKFVSSYIIGQISYNEMVSSLEVAIHQFAKRQMTWFRGMERKGAIIHWIDSQLPTNEKVAQIISIINQ